MPNPHAHPTIAHGDYPWFSIHRNLGRTPCWTFPNTLLGNELSCIRLNFENYRALPGILSEGDTKWVDERYLTETALYEQLLYLYSNGPYSRKRGAADYLVLDRPGKYHKYESLNSWVAEGHLSSEDEQRVVGVLHLYNLNQERLGPDMPNPFVGIQLTEAARGTGLAGRAISVIESYVTEAYPEAKAVTVMINKANERSSSFFARAGYEPSNRYDDWKDEVFLEKQLR